MKNLLISAFAASAFLASPFALADSHGSHDHHADQSGPTHEDCMALHETMSGMHDAHAADASSETMPAMDDDQRDMMMACHAMMEDMHAAHGEDDMSGNGEMHHDGGHGDHHGNHEMDADDENPSHDHD